MTVTSVTPWRSGEWQKAVTLFEGALQSGIPAARTSLAFAAGMEACAEGRDARGATALLGRMPALGALPSPACFLAAARACARAGEWRGSLAVWQQMVRNDMRPAPAMWRVVLEACRAAGEEAAEEELMLMQFAEREGVPLMALDSLEEE